MKRADIFRRIREIEADLQHRTPDWQRAHGAVGGRRSATTSRSGPCVRPDVDDISTGGQKYLPLNDGSFLAQGYAPTKHTRQADRARPIVQNITAFRLELLNDPEPAAGRAGPVVQGDRAR